MQLLEYERFALTRSGRLSNRKIIIFKLKCDLCGIEFERKSQGKSNWHFCSRKCLDAARRELSAYKESIYKTIYDRHGRDYFKEQIKRNQSINSVESRLKKQATLQERYGVDHPCQIPYVRKRCLEEGAKSETIEKRKQTMVERYGVDCTLKIPEIHALANTPEAWAKRHQTLKHNGSYATSKAEKRFYDWLCQIFGMEDVEHPKRVYTWLIDFYVKSINTYVLFDGEYWHGLNRPLEEIAKFKTPRDRHIYGRWHADREQDRWFQEQGLRLVRVTDRQFQRREVPECLRTNSMR